MVSIHVYMLFKTKYTTCICVYATHVYKLICRLGDILMSGNLGMAKTVRLSESEQEKIRQKAVEINKKLVEQMKQPLKDSELVHVILEEAISRIEVTKSGKVIIN